MPIVRVPPALGAEYRAAGHWRDVLVDTHVADAARRAPDALAVVDDAGSMTYAELEHGVAATAAGLHELGVVAGDVVSWQLPNWVEATLLHFAVLRLGAVSNPIVPIYRHREVGFILGQARSKVLVVPGTFRGFDHLAMAAELRAELPDLAHVLAVRAGDAPCAHFETLTKADASGLPETQRSADDAILLMFTSGTTADPKGVLHTHNTLDYENRTIIDVYGLRAGDAVFMPSPLSHITGLLYGLQLPPMLGGAAVLQPVWEPGEALQLIERHRAAFTLAATPFLHGLIHHPELPDRDISSLRVFACGGADVPPALVREGDARLRCAVTRVYGSTEFPTLTASGPEAPIADRADTDGSAIAAARFQILDEAGAAVGPGTTGELVVRGPERFVHYLRPEDDLDAFTAEGWFRTGDLACSDDAGRLSIVGRSKDIIVRGGENIGVREVENLLLEHPAVREVAIVAMPDPVLTERACAFVVPAPGCVPTLAELVDFLAAQRIARQKLPERLELIEELPRTLSGKIQKFRLRELVRDLALAGSTPREST